MHISIFCCNFASKIVSYMKNGNISLLFILAACCLVSCENQFSNTPEEDTTMLWPAGDSTGFWGFINEKGEMVIPAKYDRTYGFSGGMAQVYIDLDGKPLPTYISYETSVITSSQHAFINKRGEILFSLPEDKGFFDHYFYYGCCRYGGMRSIGMMNNHFNAFIPEYESGINLGVMTKDGLASSVLGYFNKAGKLVIPSYINGVDGNTYDKMYDFCDGIAVVYDYIDMADMYTTYHRYGAINTKGELVIDTVYAFLQSVGCNRLVYTRKDGDYSYVGLMDTQGNIITEPCIRRDWYSFFGEGGLMPVGIYQDGAQYGYMDINGNMQIPYKYAYATPFCNGYAWVLNEGFKLINMQDEVVLSLDLWQIPYYDYGFREGLCRVFYNDNKTRMYQYINLQGEIIYSWPYEPDSQGNNAPQKHEFDRKDMLLRLFEGTPYYSLALQCAQMKD